VNLILLERDEVEARNGATLSGPRARHLLTVLRAVPGDVVRVGVIDGPRGSAVVRSVDGTRVTLDCAWEPDVPSPPRVDLLLALPRPKVMRRLWAQVAALGVGRIILTNAERVERDYFDTHVLTRECYRPLLIEGLQQARDTRLPMVSVHKRFRILVEDELDGLSDTAALRLVADPLADATVSAAVSRAIREHDTRRVLIAVGPEGGWNAFELALLEERGFERVGMGARTLRTDTACVALLAIAHHTMSAMSALSD
jgi:RsmE family RNA methyltransferase